MLIYALNGFRGAQGTFHFADMPAEMNRNFLIFFLIKALGASLCF